MSLTPNEIVATQLYIAAYGRNPDAGGLAYWASVLDSGASVGSVAQAFGSSSEFHQIFDGKTPEQIATALYQNELGRAPDAAGLDYWAHSGLGAAGLLSQFASTNNTEGLVHNAQTFAKIDDALTNHTDFPTGNVSNAPIVIEHEVIKEVPGPTVTVTVPGPTVYVPTPTEPTHNVTSTLNGSLDASGAESTGAYFQAGHFIPISNSNVVLDHTSGVELGLHAFYRTGESVAGTTGSDGVTHYALDKGIQAGNHSETGGVNAAYSGAEFAFSVNTGLSNLTDHTFKLLIDTDPTTAVHNVTLDVTADFTDNAGNAHLAQNVINYGYSFLSSKIAGLGTAGAGDIPAGHYDVQLVEMVGSTAVATNHIVLDLA